MKWIIICSLMASSAVYAQNCNCTKAMAEVESVIEQDLATFQHQVVEQHYGEVYKAFKQEINKQADTIFNEKMCIGLLATYLSFFRDEHLIIQYQPKHFSFTNWNDTTSVQAFFNTDPKFELKSLITTTDNNITGKWFFEDGSFSIQIQSQDTSNFTYVGLIDDGDNYFWSRGQLKMSIQQDSEGKYWALYWRGARLPTFLPIVYNDSTMHVGRNINFYRSKSKPTASANKLQKFEFIELSPSTNYLCIPSFSLDYTDTISNLVKQNLIAIQSKPYLIIDLRNNGGGGFEAFNALLPIVLNKPDYAMPYAGSTWVSKNNFRYYNKTKYEYTSTRQERKAEKAEVNWMSKYKGNFTPVSFERDTIAEVFNSPTKVVLLTNSRSGSTTEGFVLLAKQSKKVIHCGQNTAGAISYGDIRPVALQQLPLTIYIATKKMFFPTPANYESIGIAPEILLNPAQENNWLEIIVSELEAGNW